MKAILFALCATLAVTTAYVITAPNEKDLHLLGAEKCTWGPGYWCKNITNSAECHATQHCITKEWEKMTVPEDDDNVCQICKDMVQQARDQLESNQTQQDLKTVFETSCKLMIVKPIVKECIKLADDFVPELVETLASQMNPSVVCSVSGLCNSPKIDQLLLEYKQSQKKAQSSAKLMVPLKNDEIEPNECSKCQHIAVHLENKFQKTSKDEIARNLLQVCGHMGSFSDACSSIVIVHFDTIHEHLVNNFNVKNICHLSGQCSNVYHQHEDDQVDQGPKVEIRPLSSVGMVEVDDDLPCKLCEQLVGHLRDLLVANTTETEFQQVLEGLCKQTKSFASECMSVVDQYYPEIYQYLVTGLNKNFVCQMAGICPAPDKQSTVPLMPLLPMKAYDAKVVEVAQNNQKKILGANGHGIRKYPKTEADEMLLPIKRDYDSDSLLGMPVMDVEGQKACEFCEYFLHYMQQVMSFPATEQELKDVFGKVCSKLPEAVEGTCQEFLDQYGDAVIAILIQQIDPSTVCPTLHVCPTTKMMDAWESLPKEKMIEVEVKEKSTCPFCLLAVEELYSVIKDNKTEESIRSSLDKLCSHLSKGLIQQCKDFVEAYSNELIQMLLADLTPEEVCVYLKLCDTTKSVSPLNFPQDKDGEIMTNEIPNFPANSHKTVKGDTTCVICSTILGYIEKHLQDDDEKKEIEHLVHEVCDHLPGPNMKMKCNKFVNQYGDLVIEMLSKEVSPREICALLGLCDDNVQHIVDSVSECALCQAVLSSIDNVLTNPKVDEKIEDVVSKYACEYIPAAKRNKCIMMMKVYGQSIINLLKSNKVPVEVCSRLALCSKSDFFVMSTDYLRRSRITLKQHYYQ